MAIACGSVDALYLKAEGGGMQPRVGHNSDR
ncbi:hypothetical protein J2T15_005259 [Paenibacillus harenae]|uniref:Uncharacterized protein n=1 Tax=Paenibacillus harenae TaxID=306543 RepID=A0ABT9U822_PAEHA|nr:hypothetical protein [Paenibacillus harenae]